MDQQRHFREKKRNQTGPLTEKSTEKLQKEKIRKEKIRKEKLQGEKLRKEKLREEKLREEKLRMEGTADGTERMKPLSRISVRTLVEFLLRSGDIDRRDGQGQPDPGTAWKGAQIHRNIQKSRRGSLYEAEVPLASDTEYEDLVIRVEGRADGIFRKKEPDKNGTERTVEEIKSMYIDVDALDGPYPLHLAQAKCYAYMLAEQEHLPEVGIQMTYVNLDSEEQKIFRTSFSRAELSSFFRSLTDGWYRWAKWDIGHSAARDESMKGLKFPFSYREGQKKLTAAVYHTIREHRELFLMAPTGTGKTMSCVYPAVRAVGEGDAERIFYLTGKNETLSAGREAFSILEKEGLDMRTVQITSREKICPLSEPSCNPDDCPYAKGHFDRVNDAVYELLLSGRFFGREEILAEAEKRNVCPFELTLDVSVWCDAVLCDYNYAFDPDAQLGRFFGNGIRGSYIFLIDEAHNLVERGREMYSASLVKEHVLSAKKTLKGHESGKKVIRALERVNKEFLSLRHRLAENPSGEAVGRPYLLLSFAEADPCIRCAEALFGALKEFYSQKGESAVREELLDFYFEVSDFVNACGALDEHYRIFAGAKEGEKGRTEFFLKLFCINPSVRLSENIGPKSSAVFFSATLLPLPYYKNLLTDREDVYAVYAKTSFSPEHRKILIAEDVNTVYRNRNESMYRRIASYIRKTAEVKTGNYIAFFPSYSMQKEVFRIYRSEFDDPGVNWVVQSPSMGSEEREIFMENFYEDPAESLVGFCVTGGMFSEGIDLAGTRLIGSIVVGAGIPQVSPERELIRGYFEEEGQNGFDYAYRYPGMNRVEQAAGRVIRTKEDHGVILLLDSRLLERSYRGIFPREWEDAETCTAKNVSAKLEAFWESTSGTDEGG